MSSQQKGSTPSSKPQEQKEVKAEASAEKKDSKPKPAAKKKAPTMWRQPLTTLFTFIQLVPGDILYYIIHYFKEFVGVVLMIVFAVLARQIPASASLASDIEEKLLFAGYWVGLGVLSSIGMGTGMHTFVLYLGPKVASFVMASWECGRQVNFEPSRFSIRPEFACVNPDNTMLPGELNIFALWMSVCLEGVLWGFGTALGELPPFLIARSSRLSGETPEEVEDFEKNFMNDQSFVTRLGKKFISKYSFITVLLLASIPNPLFDVAGLACGHFLIPFTTFFLATAIGKSLIKVNIQLFAIILLFSKTTLDLTISFLESNVSSQIALLLRNAQEHQQKKLFHKLPPNASHWSSSLWDTVLLLFMGYFVVSVINNRVANFYRN